METKQPKWKLIAQLGDVNPIDYGGYFIYEDETGVYPPEGEKLLIIDEDSDNSTWEIRRFQLDKCKLIDGTYLVSADLAGHPNLPYDVSKYDEWFHKDLSRVAVYFGQSVEFLRDAFCSNDIVERARAYEVIGEYHGFDNLDSYPLTYSTREEVEQRYSEDGPRMHVGRN